MNMNLSRKMRILKLSGKEKRETNDEVVREIPFTIFLQGEEIITLQCSPDKLDYLAVGFLLSEGLIRHKRQIKDMNLNQKGGYIKINLENGSGSPENFFPGRVIGSGCSGAVSFFRDINLQDRTPFTSPGKVCYPQEKISGLMNKLQHRSSTFRATGGVHCCGLSNREEIEIFTEDIGRHNAVDKIFGECLVKEISTQDGIILTSGRVSSEILIKVAKRGVSIIASRSAPTDLAVELAEKLNLTLIGFARGRRMNIYTHRFRIN